MARPNFIQLGEEVSIPILYEDRSVLAIDKPPGWMLVPYNWDRTGRNLQLAISSSILGGEFWARSRSLKFLKYIHRLDAETTGILLFAKSLGALKTYSDLFESRRMNKRYLAVARGAPKKDEWLADAKLGPDPQEHGRHRIDPKGKQAETFFKVRDRKGGLALIEARPFTGRTHQIRIHLRHAGVPIVGDELYGGKPLWLSRLKPNYRLKPGREERPLLARVALHAEQLELKHPVTGELVSITAPWPKDFNVAVKYLRQFAGAGTSVQMTNDE
jgi:RluA family pseudouridine synthase